MYPGEVMYTLGDTVGDEGTLMIVRGEFEEWRTLCGEDTAGYGLDDAEGYVNAVGTCGGVRGEYGALIHVL